MHGRIYLACSVLFILFFCLFSRAAGDGVYFPEPAIPKMPEVPHQRALIQFRDGIETLVVESSFQSDSNSVGWVLPVPGNGHSPPRQRQESACSSRGS